jgi:nucleoside-diphosphate-sugar epimerase
VTGRRILIFGYGGVGAALGERLRGEGWSLAATARTPDATDALTALAIVPVNPADGAAVARLIRDIDAVLITAPPGAAGCPALEALGLALRGRPGPAPWIGYLSTTGVYGDHAGRWVFEETPLTPLSVEAGRRVQAETAWRALADELGASLAIFRLPGLYGPGRSAFDRLRAGDARRLTRPGHLFSRLHLRDAASGVAAALARPRPGAVYNLCDDEPAPSAEVTAHAARLLNLPIPPEEPVDLTALSPAARRFWGETKRVSNAQAKAELAWRPAYPTYREGLAAILAAGG